MTKFNKALVAASGFLAVLATVLSDGNVDGSEVGTLIVAAVTAYGVYRVPNKKPEGA